MLVLVAPVIALAGCSSAYYGAMEKMGVQVNFKPGGSI